MLHVPQRTPSQLAAIEHRKKFAKDIDRRAIPISQSCHLQSVKVFRPRSMDEAFGPVIQSDADKAFGPRIYPPTVPTVDLIVNACSQYFLTPERDLVGKRNRYVLSRRRHICMYLCYELAEQSYPEIAGRFERDHTSIIYGHRRIAALLASGDELTKIDVDSLLKVLRP